MRKEIDVLDATPSKRLFLSIIADYDLNRAICELIDNGLDVWVRSGKASSISIEIALDKMQQTIAVRDNAGGLPKDDLRYVVGPGQTGGSPSEQTIGIFGVGTKRAVVALAQDIKITTRYSSEGTYQVAFDESWIENEEWELPLYEVDEITPRTTVVELQKLRVQITDEAIDLLKDHLCATYALFLKSKDVGLKVNDAALQPKYFENWAFPPKYGPRRFKGLLETEDNQQIQVKAIAGLARESSPAAGEYGVYFYCNDRLVARGLKSLEVGFTRGLAGLPHPKVSLTRVLVFLNGPAGAMPWNSSKSDIDTKDVVFMALHDWLVQVVKDYATLSRIWMGDWPRKVFKHKSGKITDVKVLNFPTAKKSFLPPMPKSRPRYGAIIAQKNKAVAKKKPWTRGLYEGIIAADLLGKQRLEQKNRFALIALDSTLEIALKEYLVNETTTYYSDAQLLSIFQKRHTLQLELQKHATIKADIWKKIAYFNGLRNKLIHERTTVGVADQQIKDYREIVEKVLKRLFKLKFEKR